MPSDPIPVVRIPFGPYTMNVDLQTVDVPAPTDPDTYYQAREQYHSIRLLQNGFPFGLAGIAWNQVMLNASRATYASARAVFPHLVDGETAKIPLTIPVVSWSS